MEMSVGCSEIGVAYLYSATLDCFDLWTLQAEWFHPLLASQLVCVGSVLSVGYSSEEWRIVSSKEMKRDSLRFDARDVERRIGVVGTKKRKTICVTIWSEATSTLHNYASSHYFSQVHHHLEGTISGLILLLPAFSVVCRCWHRHSFVGFCSRGMYYRGRQDWVWWFRGTATHLYELNHQGSNKSVPGWSTVRCRERPRKCCRQQVCHLGRSLNQLKHAAYLNTSSPQPPRPSRPSAQPLSDNCAYRTQAPRHPPKPDPFLAALLSLLIMPKKAKTKSGPTRILPTPRRTAPPLTLFPHSHTMTAKEMIHGSIVSCLATRNEKSEAAVSVTGVSGGTCLDDGDTLHTLQRLGLITLARHWRAVPELSVRKPCSPQSVSLFLRPNSRLLATIPQDTWTKGVTIAIADPIEPATDFDDRPAVKELILKCRKQIDEWRRPIM